MKITLYADALSLWCLYAARSLERLTSERGKQIEVAWQISLISGDRPLGYTKARQDWFYRRAACITGEALNPDWLEGPLTGTREANLAALAARSLGQGDLRALRALMDAAMVEGRHVARREVAIEVVAKATGLSQNALDAAMDDPAVVAELAAGGREMAALAVDQRPVLLFENAIPDRAVLSGVWAFEPIAALASTMLRDEERYLTFNDSNPQP